MQIHWSWGSQVKNKGDEGFNNAGILTFNSHVINSFVRELFQNSNDAKITGEEKIQISIEYTKIAKENIPAFDSFLKIYEAVREAHPQQKKFFIKADQALRFNEIPMLVYSDFNTNGLVGNDTDSNTSFSALVLSEGISAKPSENAGGSYGIGKNAIYGVSSLRTVFYSSMNNNKEFIFQGVSKLASYKIEDVKYEGRVYLGNGNTMMSVRNKDLTPSVFQREKQGLSQFVIGVELDESWIEYFAKAILRNYWMLLIEKGLEVKLIENEKTILEINSENTDRLLEGYFKNDIEELNLTPYGNPYLFYQAYVHGEKQIIDIPVIGKCTFYYLESQNGENNIAYTRNGMVIYSKIEKKLVGASITGVFKCNNDDGNAILRKMEPPKHDCFEPQMLEDNHEKFGIKDGTLIIKTIKEKIREIIKSTIKKFSKETETPAFLTELFEDINKAIAEGHSGSRNNALSSNETIYRKAINETISVQLSSTADNIYVSTTESIIQEPGSGLTSGTAPKDKEKSKTKGGRSAKGGSAAKGKSPKYPITTRVFYYRNSFGNNIYKAVSHSDKDLGNIELTLSQYADSGSDISFNLIRCYNQEGAEIKHLIKKDKDGFVEEYKIVLDIKKGKNIYFIEVSESQKSAFILKG